MSEAGFTAYETVSLMLEIEPSGSLENYADIVASVVQGAARVDKSYGQDAPEVDVGNDTINLRLEQEDTGRFRFYPPDACGKADDRNPRVQVNVLYSDGERDATDIGVLDVYEQLYKKEMRHEPAP